MEKEEIKVLVETEISQTRKKITELRELTEPIAPDDAIGRITRMDAINNKSVMEASLRQAEQKLQNLKRVLSLIGTPDFGICIRWRKAIPARRILVRPESLYCVNCAK